jgi:hypothetical protein
VIDVIAGGLAVAGLGVLAVRQAFAFDAQRREEHQAAEASAAANEELSARIGRTVRAQGR